MARSNGLDATLRLLCERARLPDSGIDTVSWYRRGGVDSTGLSISRRDLVDGLAFSRAYDLSGGRPGSERGKLPGLLIEPVAVSAKEVRAHLYFASGINLVDGAAADVIAWHQTVVEFLSPLLFDQDVIARSGLQVSTDNAMESYVLSCLADLPAWCRAGASAGGLTVDPLPEGYVPSAIYDPL